MIMPSALNVLIIGASTVVFFAIWRILAARWSDNSAGKAMSVIL